MIRRAGHLGLLIGLATSLSARAQVTQPTTAGDTSTPSAGIEEIVITAERRPEILEQTPIAVSVISGKDLEDRGVKTINDLGSVAPSLNIQNQQSLSYVNIRGVGLQATNPTTSSGVGYRQTEGAVNVPISDQLAFRLAGTFDSRDSFYNDLNVGGAAITSGLQPGNVDSQSGRIGVDWRPTVRSRPRSPDLRCRPHPSP